MSFEVFREYLRRMMGGGGFHKIYDLGSSAGLSAGKAFGTNGPHAIV